MQDSPAYLVDGLGSLHLFADYRQFLVVNRQEARYTLRKGGDFCERCTGKTPS